MCGIAGIISSHNQQVSAARLRLMTEAVAHRGPDGEAHWLAPGGRVGLGHRRLSIIDLSEAAAQPMHYQDRYSIVYNGEIYNYTELREELRGKGYSFRTQSDTEVLLAAYSCWQEACLAKLDGMFAFAIWDAKEQSLFAARDRFGEKPFFFCEPGGKEFLFASEMKALWAAGMERHPDQTLLLNYMALGYTGPVHQPFHTFYKDIFQLPPAHWLRLRMQTEGTYAWDTKRYWTIDRHAHSNDQREQAIEKFTHLLQHSIVRRLRSDVPVGTSLSGGLDSNSILAMIHQLDRKGEYSGHGLNAFTAVFPGFERDESPVVEQTTKKYKARSYTTEPTAAGLASELEALLRQHEVPISSASVYAQYRVFALARQQGVKVLLDGQGADETLAGYSRYIHWYLQELYMHRRFSEAAKEKSMLAANGTSFEWNWKHYIAALSPAQAARALERRELEKIRRTPGLNPDYIAAHATPASLYKPAIHGLNDILRYSTLEYGLEELLRNADRNSMAHGCEVRLPFLDHTLVEYVFSLPASFKIHEGLTKWLLRRTMQQELPPNVVFTGKKIGFEPPQRAWMQDKIVQEMIQAARTRLVAEKILLPSVLQKKIQPQDSHAAENYDWRFLTAAYLL
ncbi:MAG: asparagine synthase (glutamine-hydrolyzing) [Bacteroidetes bacterium]|nr:asparagine synthase (glutamine-hydrolyzing) [Bacteroidota bacterium]